MQPSEKKPLSKTGTYILLLVCYLILVISTFGIARSFKGWLIISIVTAIILILVPIVNEFIKKRTISIFYLSILTPIFAYAYTYFINVFLILPINYMVIYGSCLGSFIGRLFVSRNKVKANKIALIGVVLYYLLIGYITVRYVMKMNY
ncbi:MAG: hypothetical protein K0S75_2758 [Clostridia bacterium]|jgi:hypothetical protein|nr:hypothetical protein [Clostridia bacterium]